MPSPALTACIGGSPWTQRRGTRAAAGRLPIRPRMHPAVSPAAAPSRQARNDLAPSPPPRRLPLSPHLHPGAARRFRAVPGRGRPLAARRHHDCAARAQEPAGGARRRRDRHGAVQAPAVRALCRPGCWQCGRGWPTCLTSKESQGHNQRVLWCNGSNAEAHVSDPRAAVPPRTHRRRRAPPTPLLRRLAAASTPAASLARRSCSSTRLRARWRSSRASWRTTAALMPRVRGSPGRPARSWQEAGAWHGERAGLQRCATPSVQHCCALL